METPRLSVPSGRSWRPINGQRTPRANGEAADRCVRDQGRSPSGAACSGKVVVPGLPLQDPKFASSDLRQGAAVIPAAQARIRYEPTYAITGEGPAVGGQVVPESRQEEVRRLGPAGLRQR